jgi:hypothetical protein
MLKQLTPKVLLGIAAFTGVMALGSCNKSTIEANDGGLSQEQIDSISQEVAEHNNNVLNLYAENVQQDSVDMINAQKAMSTINMQSIERAYNKASNLRNKARKQLETAKEDGGEYIVKDRQEKFNEVYRKTQSAVDEYNKALKTKQMADGQVFNTNKARLNILRAAEQSYNSKGKKIIFDPTMENALLIGGFNTIVSVDGKTTTVSDEIETIF